MKAEAFYSVEYTQREIHGQFLFNRIKLIGFNDSLI